jgi:hypothetical protein
MSVLDDLNTYTTNPLDDGYIRWTKAATTWEDTAGAVHADNKGLDWTGESGALMTGRTGSQLQFSTQAAAIARSAAQVARTGKEQLYPKHQELQQFIEETGDLGFNVDGDLKVTPKEISSDPDVAHQQMEASVFLEQELGRRYTEFKALDDQVGADLANHQQQMTAHVEKQPDGKVQCFGPEDSQGQVNCFEGDGQGGGHNFKGIWAQEGDWEDAANTNNRGHFSMVDNHTFKADGPGTNDDPWSNPPMKPVEGNIPAPAIQSGGSETPLEAQASRDLGSALPPWPQPEPPRGPPACTNGEYAKDVAENFAATVAATTGLVVAPATVWDPLFLPWAAGEEKAIEATIKTGQDVIDCANRGFGG